MKIAVWRTGHEIADTVAEAVYDGLRLPVRYSKCTADKLTIEMSYNPNVIETPDIHIGYGILRGMDEVYRACDKANKTWICIDRGYFKPNHYDGYYRISLRGTQQTTGLDKIQPDYERLDKLGIEILPSNQRSGGSLVCPVTDYVKAFFRDMDETATVSLPLPCIKETSIFRPKGCERPLQNDLDKSSNVITFNSSVGWEALRQGIPVVSDPTHSIVGAYQKMLDKSIHDDLNERRKLFGIMAGLQLQLSEMRNGQLWSVLQTLLTVSMSDGMAGKQSLPMSQPIPSEPAQNHP